MRPRKIILLVDRDKDACGALAFVLKTYEWRVFKASSERDALTLFHRDMFDLVLAVHNPPRENGAHTVRALKKIRSHVPMALFIGGPDNNLAKLSQHADHLILPCTTAELIARIRIMSRRKRGPRKGTTHQVNPPAPVPALPELAAAAH